MLMPVIKGLLFDKDGTILDFYKTWVPINRAMALDAAGGDEELARALLRAGGHDPDTNLIEPRAILGASSVEAIAECFAAQLENTTPSEMVPLIAKHFREGGGKYAVIIEGAIEKLQSLRERGYHIGLATNDTEDGLRASLGRFDGLIELFDFLVGCDSGHGSKPLPGMGIAFAKAIGHSPSACAIIGDTAHDLEMGRLAGFGLRIGVLTGSNRREDLAPHADHVLESILELDSILEHPFAHA